MDEGTKFSDGSDVQFDVEVSDDASKILDETKATKIGEVSEFEKDLLSEQPAPEPVTTESEPVNTEVAPVQETPKVSVEDSEESNLFADAIEASLVDYQEGDVVKGSVRSIEKSGLLVDISYKSDGFVPNSEFSDSKSFVETSSLKEGDEIDVFIEKLETKEGYTLLSCKKAEYELVWKQLSAAVDSKAPIEVKVLSSVRGGVVAVYSGIRGFIPLSHLSVDSKESLDSFSFKISFFF